MSARPISSARHSLGGLAEPFGHPRERAVPVLDVDARTNSRLVALGEQPISRISCTATCAKTLRCCDTMVISTMRRNPAERCS